MFNHQIQNIINKLENFISILKNNFKQPNNFKYSILIHFLNMINIFQLECDQLKKRCEELEIRSANQLKDKIEQLTLELNEKWTKKLK